MLQQIQQVKMTLDNCYNWYEKFSTQGRTAEAEEMKRKIISKGGSIEEPKVEEIVEEPEEEEEAKSKGKK